MKSNNKKYTIEEVENILKQYNLILLNKTYVNNHTPLKCLYQNKYYVSVQLSNILNNQGVLIFGIKNPYTIENIKIFLSECRPTSELLSLQYTGNTSPLDFKCSLCNQKYSATWANITKNMRNSSFKGCVCSRCRKRYNSNNQILPHSKVILNFQQRGYNLLNSSTYKNNTTKLLCKDSEGYIGYLSYNNMMRGKHFYRWSLKFNPQYFKHNLLKLIENRQDKVKLLEFGYTYNSSDTWIKLQCDCGKIFYVSQCNFVRAKNPQRICGICSRKTSSIERKVIEYLDSLNIKYCTQYSFEGCGSQKKSFLFDFYLMDYKCIIECDGRQHFEVVNFGNQTKSQARYNFMKNQRYDRLKNEYCRKNNITLLRIHHSNFITNNYKNLISQLLLNDS